MYTYENILLCFGVGWFIKDIRNTLMKELITKVELIIKE